MQAAWRQGAGGARDVGLSARKRREIRELHPDRTDGRDPTIGVRAAIAVTAHLSTQSGARTRTRRANLRRRDGRDASSRPSPERIRKRWPTWIPSTRRRFRESRPLAGTLVAATIRPGSSDLQSGPYLLVRQTCCGEPVSAPGTGDELADKRRQRSARRMRKRSRQGARGKGEDPIRPLSLPPETQGDDRMRAGAHALPRRPGMPAANERGWLAGEISSPERKKRRSRNSRRAHAEARSQFLGGLTFLRDFIRDSGGW